MKKTLTTGTLAAAVFLAASWSIGPTHAAGDAKVIELTQTACQFVEVEGVDHGYTSSSKADCEAINDQSGADRLAGSKTLELEPGNHVFRVTNHNVPYELGFWLRGDGLINRASLPSVSGGGLAEGATEDYEITLEPGEYVFSCPLNPTLDYKIVVAG